MTLPHGGGGGGSIGVSGARRPEPDPVAGVWARVSPSLLRPPLLSSGVWLAEPGWRSEAWSPRRPRWRLCRPKCGRSWRSWSWSSRRVGAARGCGRRAPLRSRRGAAGPPRALGAVRERGEEDAGNLAPALEGRLPCSLTRGSGLPVSFIVFSGRGLSRAWGSLPPQTRDKAAPSARSASGHGGGGGELRAGR